MIPNISLVYIHLRLCTILKNEEPFGGCNIIILGDLLQLAPVRGEQIFQHLSASTARKRIGSFGSYNLWKIFSYDEFIINMRQNNDKPYGDMCSRIRVGQINTEDHDFLKSKIINLEEGDKLCAIANLYIKLQKENENLICMMPLVKQCNEVNKKLLISTCTDIKEVVAIDSIESNNFTKKQKEISLKKIEKLKDDKDKTAGLSTTIFVAINARIMFTRNIDLKRGIVNGKIGTVKNFIYCDDMRTIKKIVVDFDGNQTREIERVNAKFELGRQIYAYRNQFPIDLAYAITIHKAQGKTFDSAIIDCSRKIFACGQAYVALSRMVSSKGLFLVHFDKESVIVNRDALKEYNRLRKKIRPELPLYVVPKENKKRKFETDFKILQEESSVQPPQSPPPKRMRLEYKGMENPDAVSCYCNAALQLLYTAPEVITEILNSQSTFTTDVKDITSSFCSVDNSSVDAHYLRTSLANENIIYQNFSLPRQQDSSEFLLALLDTMLKYNINVNDYIGYTEEIVNPCQSCLGRYRVGILQEVFSYAICLPDQVDKVSFQELLHSQPHEGFNCSICSSTVVQMRTVHILNPRKYLLLEVRSFRLNTKLFTKITNFKYKDVKLGNFKYKVVGAIAHEGNTLSCGHYVNYVRKDDVCLKISNTNVVALKRFVTNMNNLYVLLLEKV